MKKCTSPCTSPDTDPSNKKVQRSSHRWRELRKDQSRTVLKRRLFKIVKKRKMSFSAIVSKSVINQCYKPYIFGKIFSSSTLWCKENGIKNSKIHSRQF